MKSYDIGYCKPPKEFQFKKGVCPNPKGRGVKKPLDRHAILDDVLNTPAIVMEHGKRTKKTRIELSIRNCAYAAAKGDVASAALLLKTLKHLEKTGDLGPQIIVIENALPDLRWK